MTRRCVRWCVTARLRFGNVFVVALTICQIKKTLQLQNGLSYDETVAKRRREKALSLDLFLLHSGH